jgi:hypothetical protein
MTRKYLVFLDIDGVLTSNRVHTAHAADYGMWARFDPVAVDFFNKIHDRHPVQFVIMSTWKKYLDATDQGILHWVQSAFANSGFRGSLADPWKTDPTDLAQFNRWDRAHEVQYYLEQYGPDIEDYILFDDNTYQFKTVLGKGRLIHTDPENGLLYKHMLNAQSMMGTWHKK